MLSDEQLFLITAAIDGELSRHDAARVRKLLEESSEAARLYEHLHSDRLHFQNLPQALPPVNLQQRVMAKIAALTPPPGTLPSARVPTTDATSQASHKAKTNHSFSVVATRSSRVMSRNRRGLLPVALAAGLLLAIGGSSFVFFSSASQKSKVVRHSVPGSSTAQGRVEQSDWSQWLPPEQGPQPVAPTPALIAHFDGKDPVTWVAPKPDALDLPTVAIAPTPRAAINQSIVGAEIRPDLGPLDVVQVRVPFLRSLSDFERDETRQQFIDETSRDPAFRIDMFVRNLPRAVELMQNAARNTGVALQADTVSLERVQKGQVSAVAVYMETLNSQELADLFSRLAGEDARISPRVCHAIHVTPIAPSDQDSLRNLLGLDPGLFKRSRVEKQEKEKSRNLSQSITQGTGDEIVRSLSQSKSMEQGSSSDKSGILMTWLPQAARTPPTSSAELKQFMSKRGERKASVVPVVIVIRYRNG